MCIRDSGFAANLGFGFLYPVAYCEAVTKMKEGNLGEQGKEFFEAFPDGAISVSYTHLDVYKRQAKHNMFFIILTTILI